MPRIGKPGRWFFPIILVVVSVLGSFWAGSRLFPSPGAKGRAAYQRGDWPGAFAWARARLEKNRDDPDALRLLARASARLGRDDSARALFQRVGEKNYQAEDFYLLGQLIVRGGKPELAKECWRMAHNRDPNHPETLQQMARMALDQGEVFAAERLARQLAAQPGWAGPAALIRATALTERNDPVAAAALFRQALDNDPAPETRKALVRALLRARKPDEARRVLLGGSSDAESAWLLSRACLQQGDVAGAKAALARAGTYRAEHAVEPEPAPYVGPDRCAECHRANHRAEQSSRHAHTFARGADLTDLSLPDRPLPDAGDPAVTHVLSRAGDEIRLETRVGNDVYRAVVEYAFGSGDRGLTLVGRDESETARELRLSRYGEIDRWSETTGQALRPGRPADFLGRPLSADDLRGCFECHTTQPDAAQSRTGPEPAARGIGCEQCHGPGGHHLAAVEAKLDDLAIARAHHGKAGEVVTICARCHSPRGVDVKRDDPASARFQTVSLTWSRCYTESAGVLDCLTCHNPHRDAATTPAHYEARCLSCHAAATPGKTPCPVNPTRQCLSCHMPVVRDASPHTTFTDHYIRIIK
jgi:tetratricopeptide (TPR) repeat protein